MPELAFFRRGEELLRVPLGDRTAIGRDPACDVSLPDPALSRVQAVIEQAGRIDALVNNAGQIGPAGAFEEVSLDQLRAQQDAFWKTWQEREARRLQKEAARRDRE